MLQPTMFFQPFGSDGPKIVLFGKQTGDWNSSCFHEKGDHLSSPGLYSRFDTLAKQYHFSNLLMPVPTDCNTKVCSSKDLGVHIQNGHNTVTLQRGVQADGVVLQRGFAGAIASADCPTIVAYCPSLKTTIIAHGGCKSLIDIVHVLCGYPPRESGSVVDQIIKTAEMYGFCQMKVFITCGISVKNYTFYNLVLPVAGLFGGDCVYRPHRIDLKKIIAVQFARRGIFDVTTDVLDTHDDRDEKGNFIWHSHRRGETPEAKAGRNLVLVIN